MARNSHVRPGRNDSLVALTAPPTRPMFSATPCLLAAGSRASDRACRGPGAARGDAGVARNVPAVAVRLAQVVKRFGDVPAVDGIDIEIRDGRSEERRVGKECRTRWWPGR